MIAQGWRAKAKATLPGLASESEGYPGLFAIRGNNAVGVVPFIPNHFIAAFHAENVQHLRR